jgi:hypothetical protein
MTAYTLLHAAQLVTLRKSKKISKGKQRETLVVLACRVTVAKNLRHGAFET